MVKTSELRIIAGKWRSRKLKFPANLPIRPTTNVVRETLFNWLAPFINGASCLDLFAGSGALGFEALSRGASYVVMVDQSYAVIEALKANAALLTAENIEFFCTSFSSKLKSPFARKFNIVFLDPPFTLNIIQDCCEWLVRNDLLAANALIYTETARQGKSLVLPCNWQIYHDKIRGDVRYSLWQLA
jgi:16S rRNA (guanine966-N2)-methyltransferase